LKHLTHCAAESIRTGSDEEGQAVHDVAGDDLRECSMTETMHRLRLGAAGIALQRNTSAPWRDKLEFPFRRDVNWNTLQGRLPMKIEKYLLLALVVFFLIVIGTYLHKMVH
jgi:hypothetical protein